MSMEARQKERPLDAVCRPRAFLHRTLQPVHRLIQLAEASVDIRAVVRRDERAACSLFELPQYLARLRRVARHPISLSQLAQPHCVSGGDRNRRLQFGQTFILLSTEEIGPAECGARAIITLS